MSQKVDYGFFLLSILSQKKAEGCVSIQTIAKQYHLSFAFLQKVAGLLKTEGLISSSRGKYGGYVLAKKPKHIPLRTIIEALDGPIAITSCTPCIRKEFCTIQKGLKKINEEIRGEYLSRTLANLIA